MLKLLGFFIIFFSQTVGAAGCETKREIYIENKLTKVWKTTICPKQKLPFHTHQFARVVIPEQNGLLRIIYRGGKKELLKLEKQTPVYLSVSQGRESHQDINIGNKPLQVTVIELRN